MYHLECHKGCLERCFTDFSYFGHLFILLVRILRRRGIPTHQHKIVCGGCLFTLDWYKSSQLCRLSVLSSYFLYRVGGFFWFMIDYDSKWKGHGYESRVKVWWIPVLTPVLLHLSNLRHTYGLIRGLSSCVLQLRLLRLLLAFGEV